MNGDDFGKDGGFIMRENPRKMGGARMGVEFAWHLARMRELGIKGSLGRAIFWHFN